MISNSNTPPDSGFRESLKINLSCAARYGGFTALLSGAALFLLVYLRYADIWYASAWDKVLHFVYLTGQYGGWILLVTLLAAIFISLISLLLRRFKSPARPGLFYALLGITLQLIFWAELCNMFFPSALRRSLGSLRSAAVIIILAALLYIVVYQILRRILPNRAGTGKRVKPAVYSIPVYLLLAFIGSFFVPLAAEWKSIDGSEAVGVENYDGEGTLLMENFTPPGKLYNILLLSIDTLRGDGLGCYGYPKPVSPFIDSLAQHGVRFKNAYSVSPWTMPAHGTLFTALYPYEHGAVRMPVLGTVFDRVDDSKAMLSEILDFFGYYTAAFISHFFVSSKCGFNQGFDLFDEGNEGSDSFREAVNFLKSYDLNEPFFLFLHTFLAHEYEPSPYYEKMFCDPALSPRKEEIKVFKGNIHHNQWIADRNPGWAEYFRGLYDASVRETDDRFAEVMNILQKRGILDNTVVIILSDHGEEFWERGSTGHGFSLYEEQMRVPLIFLLPPETGLSGITVDGNVCLFDILPTILDLMGLPPHHQARGESLLPAMSGEKLPPRKFYLETCIYENEVGVVEGERKFIYRKMPPLEKGIFTSKRVHFPLRTILHYGGDELYDLNRDPAEKVNLIAEKPDAASELREDLIRQFLLRYPQFLRMDISGGRRLDKKDVDKLRATGYVH